LQESSSDNLQHTCTIAAVRHTYLASNENQFITRNKRTSLR